MTLAELAEEINETGAIDEADVPTIVAALRFTAEVARLDLSGDTPFERSVELILRRKRARKIEEALRGEED